MFWKLFDMLAIEKCKATKFLPCLMFQPKAGKCLAVWYCYLPSRIWISC